MGHAGYIIIKTTNKHSNQIDLLVEVANTNMYLQISYAALDQFGMNKHEFVLITFIWS